MIQRCNNVLIRLIGMVFALALVLSISNVLATNQFNQPKPVVVADSSAIPAITPNPSNTVKFETITVETSAASELTAEPIQKL
ncbi:MAG TPA: hypothetical protein PKZ49_09715, partial [Nitrosomonas sp.]|nr:hypothetical protein [Nitrosomonas sp.]